eukprot:3166549-Amphidinium_carterae.1
MPRLCITVHGVAPQVSSASSWQLSRGALETAPTEAPRSQAAGSALLGSNSRAPAATSAPTSASICRTSSVVMWTVVLAQTAAFVFIGRQCLAA